MASLKRKAKGALKSKTVGFNALAVAAGVVDILATNGAVLAALGPWGPLGLALGNVILRGITSEALEDKAL